MKILVTGGAGFIGSHIIDLALERGHEVAALDDLSSGKTENLAPGVKLYQVDIRDKDATRRAFEDYRPDAVSHQAAQASVSVSMKDPALDGAINIVGGLNVADAARDVGAERFVFASTGGAIYGNIASGAADEAHPTDPISPYAIHKFAYERLLTVYAEAGQLKPTVLRYANVFGPRQDPHGEAGVVAIFFDRAREDLPLAVNAMRTPGDGGCIRDYVYVSDVARANLAALEGTLEHRLMNVGTSIPTSTGELLKEILSRCPGTKSKVGDNGPRAGDVERSVLNGERFRSELGDFVKIAAGLDLTAKWYAAKQG